MKSRLWKCVIWLKTNKPYKERILKYDVMETLVVKLKQHTPLIHFQSTQDGATLRASEVKPRLDRFLIEKLGDGIYKDGLTKAAENKWLIGEKALNYKMKIVPKGKVKIEKIESNSLFFANMNIKNTDPSYKCFYFVDSLELCLSVFNTQSDMLDWIKPYFCLFFMINNFGTRSSKGFGSFYVSEDDPSYAEPDSNYKFKLPYDPQQYKELFKDISLFYKSLRGGINQHKFYFKSLLFVYCDEILNAKWDKRIIKETFYGIPPSKHDKCYDMRDLLGFSTVENWGKQYDTITKSIVKDKSDEQKVPERMQSPLLIKPIYDSKAKCFTIYLRFVSPRTGLKDFMTHQVCVCSKLKRKLLILNMPKPECFKLNSFFRYIRENFDIEEHVEKQYHCHEFFKNLQGIYKQIKENNI